MRLCRFEHRGRTRVGFYRDDDVIPLHAAVQARNPESVPEGFGATADLLPLLLPRDPASDAARELAVWIAGHGEEARRVAIATTDVRLLAPISAPPKLLLLAGNYAQHIQESGGIAVERARTFPYVFMKPPSTTINHPGADIAIPSVSPEHIDWEIELGVVIGKRASAVAEKDALSHVAGYTVVNDISDRHFRPNPNREERKKDAFFDWLHGKWHDGFCPMGPCVLSADAVEDPQKFRLRLEVNGEVQQDATTAQQVFPVAAIIAFLSRFVTLEPGDIISTGTPAGVGAAKGTFLRAGDRMRATIDGIGVLENRMVAG